MDLIESDFHFRPFDLCIADVKNRKHFSGDALMSDAHEPG